MYIIRLHRAALTRKILCIYHITHIRHKGFVMKHVIVINSFGHCKNLCLCGVTIVPANTQVQYIINKLTYVRGKF